MKIYFSGIGGVGLGPLANIALDAGYDVTGSDLDVTPFTKSLGDRGVTIADEQKGMHLQRSHDESPIDWFVYTSALPDDHPELALARMLGIRTSKRDDLIKHIIEEKGLKLVAVAGTHGKTGTTAMLIWTLLQLGVPISYSVGTTMPFAPSGKFDPESEYFVYECDEYDRNFLSFNPHLAVITSIDYDHPDTYGSPDDYIAAFRQFISQSQHAILWQGDANLMGDLGSAWVLGEHDLADVTLPGEHTRRNASLVIKALEHLDIHGDELEAINRFPGVDRRFETIGYNLYSDYGHHPVEIAATLQLARELSDDVVLVYQPHQNTRQHEVRSQYADAFELANGVYWLPTYLTREKPDLPILTREELIEDIENKDIIRLADLDDALWENIQKARDRGALVLTMGAGTIDGWVRAHYAARHVARVLILDADGNFILQKRDDDQAVDPGKLEAFGGTVEAKDTSLIGTAIRELREETNLHFDDKNLEFFRLFVRADDDNNPVYIAYYVLKGMDVSELKVYEGQGFEVVPAAELNHHPLTIPVRSVITEYNNPTFTV